jgi:hypothetical protein
VPGGGVPPCGAFGPLFHQLMHLMPCGHVPGTLWLTLWLTLRLTLRLTLWLTLWLTLRLTL